jgi:hypothetical protein
MDLRAAGPFKKKNNNLSFGTAPFLRYDGLKRIIASMFLFSSEILACFSHLLEFFNSDHQS